jgi:polysaccharide export outer membrane protein
MKHHIRFLIIVARFRGERTVNHTRKTRSGRRSFRTALVPALALPGVMLLGCANPGDELGVSSGFQAVEPGRSGLPSGGQSHLAAAMMASSTPGNSAYKIGPLDVLDISVFRVPELSKTVQVADTGTVGLPLVGEVRAAGRTAQEVERDLTAKLGARYLQKPQVTVYIKEYNSQRVTVEGAVKKPGVFPISGRASLLQFIATAEGLDTSRASSEVVVFRQAEGKRVAAKFDLDEIRAGRAADPLMQPGDLIIVHDSAAKIAFNNLLKILPASGAFIALF